MGSYSAVRCNCKGWSARRFCPACGGTGWVVRDPSWPEAVGRLRNLWVDPQEARLRAAAPHLADALDEILSWIEGEGKPLRSETKAQLVYAMRRFGALAREALREAGLWPLKP